VRVSWEGSLSVVKKRSRSATRPGSDRWTTSPTRNATSRLLPEAGKALRRLSLRTEDYTASLATLIGGRTRPEREAVCSDDCLFHSPARRRLRGHQAASPQPGGNRSERSHPDRSRNPVRRADR